MGHSYVGHSYTGELITGTDDKVHDNHPQANTTSEKMQCITPTFKKKGLYVVEFSLNGPDFSVTVQKGSTHTTLTRKSEVSPHSSVQPRGTQGSHSNPTQSVHVFFHAHYGAILQPTAKCQRGCGERIVSEDTSRHEL